MYNDALMWYNGSNDENENVVTTKQRERRLILIIDTISDEYAREIADGVTCTFTRESERMCENTFYVGEIDELDKIVARYIGHDGETRDAIRETRDWDDFEHFANYWTDEQSMRAALMKMESGLRRGPVMVPYGDASPNVV